MAMPRRNNRTTNQGSGNRTASRDNNRPHTLYARATAVVRNNKGHVLLVKHNRQRDWAHSPVGGSWPGSAQSRCAMLEVAEETGLQIKSPRYVGRYAGNVSSHEIYEADAAGEPRPNRRELQDAIWWDSVAPLELQPHVNAILAIVNVSRPTGDATESEYGEDASETTSAI